MSNCNRGSCTVTALVTEPPAENPPPEPPPALVALTQFVPLYCIIWLVIGPLTAKVDMELTGIFETVFAAPEIVLLVRVSVLSFALKQNP